MTEIIMKKTDLSLPEMGAIGRLFYDLIRISSLSKRNRFMEEYNAMASTEAQDENIDENDPIVAALNRVYGKNPEISHLPKGIAAAQFETLKRHG